MVPGKWTFLLKPGGTSICRRPTCYIKIIPLEETNHNGNDAIAIMAHRYRQVEINYS